MRTIFAICGLTLLLSAVLAWRYLQKPAEFGTFVGAPQIQVADVLKDPKHYLGQTVTLEGTIREQCKSMGCFFFLSAGSKQLRVDLQEIAMTAPMREGRPVRVEGQIVTYQEGYQLWAGAVEFK